MGQCRNTNAATTTATIITTITSVTTATTYNTTNTMTITSTSIIATSCAFKYILSLVDRDIFFLLFIHAS